MCCVQIYRLLHDRDEVKSLIRGDVDNLTSSINNLHHLVLGFHHDSSSTIHTRSADDNELLPTKDLLNTLKSLTDGVHHMKAKLKDSTR